MLKLKLENYRQFIETDEIVFPAGLTIISGPNGAGKSNLVESVSYALFGPKRGPGEGGVRSDNAVGDVAVCCTLQIDDHDVEIRRRGKVAELRFDGTLQVPAGPNSIGQVNRQLAGLLGGLSRDEFEEIYIAEQGQTAGLVASKPRKRRELLGVALQLDVLEEARRLQERERDEQVFNVKAQADAAVDTLGLSAEERRSLDQLKNARQASTRRQYLDLFLAHVDGAVSRLKEAADEAQRKHEKAQQGVVAALEARNSKAQVAESANDAVVAHQERYEAYDRYREPIAEKNALWKAAIDAAEKKGKEIASAQACASAARRYQVAGAALDLVDRRRGRLPQVKDRWSALARAVRDLRSLDRQVQDLGDPAADLSEAEAKEGEAKRRWDALQDDPRVEDAAELQRWQGELDLEEKQIRAALDALEVGAPDARCPTCDRPLGAHARQTRLEHLQAWLTEEFPRRKGELDADGQEIERRRQVWKDDKEQARDAWQRAINAATTAKSRQATLNALVPQHGQAERSLTQAREEWRELGEGRRCDPHEVGRLNTEGKRLTARAARLREPAERYASISRRQQELEQEREKVQAAAEKLECLRREQDETGYDAEAHQCAKEQADQVNAEFNAVVMALQTAKSEAQLCKSEAEQRGDAIRVGKGAQTRSRDGAISYRREERLLELLSGFYRRLFAQNTEAIARRASDLIVQAVTDGSILGVQIGRDGELTYLDASHVRQAGGRLSGGERALVGLCLRMALAEQALRIARAGKLHFLILDEVLSSLDDERREAIQRVFDDVQRQGVFEHIVMITHLETVKQGWHGARLQVEKVDTKTSRVLAAATDGAADEPGTFADDDLGEVADA